jgi:hypothetical protein
MPQRSFTALVQVRVHGAESARPEVRVSHIVSKGMANSLVTQVLIRLGAKNRYNCCMLRVT